MSEKRHLVQIAEALGVKQYINEKTVTEDVLERVIAHNCKLDNIDIQIAIQNAELDLNETDRQSLIEYFIAVGRGQQMEMPRTMSIKTASNNKGGTAPTVASNDYQTLMLVGQINSFLGWLMVVGCGLGILNGVGTGQGSVIIGAALLIPLSLLVVASGQVVSCIVSTTRNGKETNILLQKILDKMDAAG